MSHPLETRIGALRLRVRGLLAVYGAGWWLACAVGAVVVAAGLDYALRFREPGMRVLVALAVLSVLAWSAFRFLYRPWSARLGNVDLARRVQARFPSLGDDLASAVEFLGQAEDDPTAGSAELRRAVVARAADAAKELDFRLVVRARPAWLAGLAAAAAALFAAMLAMADPAAARIAVVRLARPWAEIPWPQVHHLKVRNPVQRMARGQAFEVEVVDAHGSRLPSEARIFYRFDGAGGANQESEPMRLVHGMLVARRERVTRSFSYRVEGGDDRSMPWQPVEVVDPPTIATLRATLSPPDYTGWPQASSEGNIRALAGTRVEIAATATKPLASAVLVRDPAPPLAARLDGEGLHLAVPADPGSPWILEQSGSYGFRLADRDGVSGGEEVRWEIRVVPDAPPSVALEEPDAGAEPFVVPDAEAPVAAAASDDLAIQRVDLCFTRSDRPADPPARKTLYAGPPSPGVARPGGGLEHAAPDRRAVRTVWKLDALKLAPGAEVAFWFEAADYKPQTAKSEVRRLSIVARDDLARRLVSREAEILAELSRVLAIQRRGREQVAALEQRAAERSRLEQSDVDRLRGAELHQRQIERSLASRGEGIPGRIHRLLADLNRNKLPQPGMEQRMESILSGLERLAVSELAAAGRELTAAVKSAQALLEPPAAGLPATALRTPLAAAGKHQDAIIAALERMTDELGRANRLREFSGDLDRLAREQDDLAAHTGQLARRTLAKPLKDLAPQEAADLADAARRQAEIADRWEAIEQAMDEAVKRAGDDPAAANVSDGLRRARELDLAGPMRSAGDQIRRNQLGQAAENQQRAREGLREIADRVAGRRPGQTAETGTIPAAPSLDEIRRQQEEINRRTRELETRLKPADRSSPEARRQYEQLSRDQAKLGEKLQNLLAPPLSKEGKP